MRLVALTADGRPRMLLPQDRIIWFDGARRADVSVDLEPAGSILLAPGESRQIDLVYAYGASEAEVISQIESQREVQFEPLKEKARQYNRSARIKVSVKSCNCFCIRIQANYIFYTVNITVFNSISIK